MKSSNFLLIAVATSVFLLSGCMAVPLLVDGASFGTMGNAAATKDSTVAYTTSASRAEVFNAALSGLSSVGGIKSSDREAGIIQGDYENYKVAINLSDLPSKGTQVSIGMKYAGLMKLDATTADEMTAKLINVINKQSTGVVLAKADK